MPISKVEATERMMASFAERDLDGVLERCHPAIEWTTAEDEPDHQTYRGHDGIRQLYAHWSDLWEAGFEAALEVGEIAAAGDEVIVPLRVLVRGKSSGAEVEINETYRFTFSGELVATVREYRTKEAALDAVDSGAE